VGPRSGVFSDGSLAGDSWRGMRGNVFSSSGNDAFDSLGYLADLGTGTFYLLARSLETSGADVSHAGGDYGTRFLATAGVLNLLAALHAYEAARGRKHETQEWDSISVISNPCCSSHWLISIAFGFLSRRRPIDRVKYIVWSLFLFC